MIVHWWDCGFDSPRGLGRLTENDVVAVMQFQVDGVVRVCVCNLLHFIETLLLCFFLEFIPVSSRSTLSLH